MSADKRSSNRVPLNTKVHLEFEKFSGFVSEFSHNISPGGMFIKTPNPLPIGSIVSFEFKLKDSFQLIQGLGEVTWIRSNMISPDEPAGMGVRFREISDRSRDLIKAIVTQTKSQGDKPFDIDDQPDAVTSTISAQDAKEVYGSEPLKDALSSVPSSSDTTQAQPNNTRNAIDNLDAHLIDNTVSNPHLNTNNNELDPSQATHTALFDSQDQNLNLNDLEEDPLTSPDDEHTFASMQDSVLSDSGSGLSDSFELSLDEEMNDPDLDNADNTAKPSKSEKNSSSFGVKVFLSLIFVSLLASAYLLKDLYLPTLQNVPFIAQFLPAPESKTPISVQTPSVEEKIQALTKNETPVEEINPSDNSTAVSQSNASSQEGDSKQAEANTEKNQIDETKQAKNSPMNNTPKQTTPTRQKTSATKLSQSETTLSSESQKTTSASSSLASAQAKQSNLDSNLLKVKNLTWTVDKDDWVLVVETDKNMDKSNIVHSSLRNGPARELIILKGMQKSFSNRTIPVEQTGVYRIRTGYHADKDPAQLHIVIDILNPEIKMKKTQALGNIVKIFFGVPTEP
ncbi:TIGR02266 family protein [bacterium]|nr:TIGR02266 family protein [bacterium]